MTRAIDLGLVVVAAALVAGGCEPVVKLTVALPDNIDPADVLLQADGYAPGSDVKLDCEKLAFGEVTRDQLLPTRFFDEVLTEDGKELTKIPKAGRKMILVDALDKDGVRVASGCADLGAIRAGGDKITIVMQNTADVAFDDDAVLIVGDPETGKSVFVKASDGAPLTAVTVTLQAGGEGVDGVVRFTRRNADGTTAVIGDVDAVGGVAALSPPAVAGAGPFEVFAQARFARSDAPTPPLRGLAVFARDVDVGGAEAGADFVALSPPAAFAFAVPSSDGTSHVVTIADARQGAALPPSTALVATTTSSTVAHAPGIADPSHAPKFLGTYVEGEDVFVAMDIFGGVCGGALQHCTTRAPEPASFGATLLRPGSAALGPCSTATGAPFAFIESGGAAIEIPVGTALVNENVAALLGFITLDAGACGDDVDGVTHRVLRATFNFGFRSPVLVDLGEGVQVPPVAGVDLPFTVVELPGLTNSPAVARAADGSLLVPLQVIGGFVVASVTLDGATVVENAEIVQVPFKPVAIAAGHFTAPDADETALLAMPGADDDTTRDRTLLFVAGATGVAGAIPLDCRGPLDCHLLAADVDGDGKDDLLVARVDSAGQPHLESYRF